jgi:hypothetical protein
VLENTELVAPNPAGDGGRLGDDDDEHSSQAIMKRKDILGLVGCLVFRNSGW